MTKAFTEFEHCRSRAHCLACRNNKIFRDSLVRQFGPFECPLGLPLGASAESMPAAWHAYRAPAALPAFVHPSPTRCIFSARIVGHTTEQCCGGKTKEVDQWECRHAGLTTARACSRCARFLVQSPKQAAGPVELLVGSKECADCLAIELRLGKPADFKQELHIIALDTDDQARSFLDGQLKRTDLYVPALFIGLKFQTWEYQHALDDPEEIVEYLKREGYIA